jgi:cephalosporin hydroxylase
MADITKLTEQEHAVTNEFHKVYYPFFSDTRWLGVAAQKCPFDLFVYQELIFELRPDLIIECGTFDGGSAVFLASICELAGHGGVVTIDLQANPARPPCPRVTYWQGDSLSADVLKRLEDLVAGKQTVMVILDDDHSRDHVLQELRTYSRFVTPGSYLIVEDTNINGHPVNPDFGPGPMEALDLFMGETAEFEIDRSREKFLVSFNPRGFLKKRGQGERARDSQTIRGFLSLPDELREKNELLRSQNAQLTALQNQLLNQSATLELVLNSKGWRFLNRYRDTKARIRGLFASIFRKRQPPLVAAEQDSPVRLPKGGTRLT